MSRMALPGIAAAVAAAVAAAAGAAPQTPDQQPPTFRTEANYVRVDVFPTRDGQPVLDLEKDDFAILDEGVLQTIEQFERIAVPGNVPQRARREPSTVAESRQMLDEARARVIVLFLDTPHVDLVSSRRIGPLLAELLEHHLGADDMVGVVTPGMPARDVTFARRTEAIEQVLARDWWGERDRLFNDDPVEQRLEACYSFRRPIRLDAYLQELIDRHREQQTLDTLENLVRFLGGVREERKAILVVTAGWRLFQPRDIPSPLGANQPPEIGTVPGTGRLGIAPALPGSISPQNCESDRMALASMDSEQQFTRIVEEANHANASFYPIDPQGLSVFDAPIGPNPPPPPTEDAARLRARGRTLRRLADDTDGLAIVDTNELASGLDRIVADLSSYYLLGYYATGVTMDGRFHRITVRVKQPGVAVRARPGYLAPSAADVAALSAAASASRTAAATPGDGGLGAAFGTLAGLEVDRPLRVAIATFGAPAGAAAWIVAEVGPGAEWAGGAQVDAIVTTASGETVGIARGRVEPGARSAALALGPSPDLTAGDYRVSVRASALAGGAAAGADARIAVSDGRSSGALVFRRGPATGNRDVATADLRFRRTDRVRVEIPADAPDAFEARLVDRNGAPLGVPVAVGQRDVDGITWRTADVSLAPLAPGEYAIEFLAGAGSDPDRRLVAFRVVR